MRCLNEVRRFAIINTNITHVYQRYISYGEYAWTTAFALNYLMPAFTLYILYYIETKFRDLSSRANYDGRAAAACQRS
jgi:hypothetical protein